MSWQQFFALRQSDEKMNATFIQDPDSKQIKMVPKSKPSFHLAP